MVMVAPIDTEVVFFFVNFTFSLRIGLGDFCLLMFFVVGIDAFVYIRIREAGSAINREPVL